MNLLTLKAKLIIGAIVLTIITTTAVMTVNRIKADAFKQGQASERQLHAKALAKAEEINRTKTLTLERQIDDYARQVERLSNQRREREQVVVTKIKERLVEQPNCQIDPQIIALRNQVRAS